MAPLPVKPTGQGPQTGGKPTRLVQVAALSHPPLLVMHSSMSMHPRYPVPLNPLGQSPHVGGSSPGLLVQETRASQPPFRREHLSITEKS